MPIDCHYPDAPYATQSSGAGIYDVDDSGFFSFGTQSGGYFILRCAIYHVPVGGPNVLVLQGSIIENGSQWILEIGDLKGQPLPLALFVDYFDPTVGAERTFIKTLNVLPPHPMPSPMPPTVVRAVTHYPKTGTNIPQASVISWGSGAPPMNVSLVQQGTGVPFPGQKVSGRVGRSWLYRWPNNLPLPPVSGPLVDLIVDGAADATNLTVI